MKHVAPIGATTSTKSPTAMDIGGIGNFGDEDKEEEKSWQYNEGIGKKRHGEGKERRKASMQSEAKA